MQISISKLAQFVTIAVVIGLISYTGYFLVQVFFTGPQPVVVTSIKEVSSGVFSPKLNKVVQSLTNESLKINLDKDKDLGFQNTPLFKSFQDDPEVVPLNDTRGRPDPFNPYVAP